MANASVFSSSHGNTVQGVGINDSRRKFNFGERVAELAPQQSPFFVYLNKVAKKATDDPVFKFLEQRHQWQRRNFEVRADLSRNGATPTLAELAPVALSLTCAYDQYGNVTGTDTAPNFLLVGQMIVVEADADFTGSDATDTRVRVTCRVTTVAAAASNGVPVTADIISINNSATGANVPLTDFSAGGDLHYLDGYKGQVIGSAFDEGTGAPDGWEDKMYDREGYCQIFKTGMNIFSGTAMATHYRGISNEWQRVWQEKLMEHKMDIEQAMLFGIGRSNSEITPGATSPQRHSWGIVPYTEQNGKIYNMTYASSGYDAFLDAMEDFFAPESGNSGNKLVLASRKVITYLNKLGSGSFLNNSVGSSQYRLDITSVPGAFGHQVTVVNTIFGNLHFVADPLLRGLWEDYCVAVDLKNVAYRPLVGNGISRDTFIETNVQTPDIDGRQDQIITEAGLEISLPETHAILKWS